MSPEEPAPSDVRQRRAERSKSGRWREAGRRSLKPLAVLLAVVAVGAVVWGAMQLHGPGIPHERTRHWHAAFNVFVDGNEVDFHKCEFDLNGCQGRAGIGYVPAHLHYNDEGRYVLHIEHPVSLGNLTLGRVFDRWGFNLTNTSFTLDGRVYHRERYENNATHTWQLWAAACFTEPPKWSRITDLPGYAMQQHDRFLLTYTNATSFDEISWQTEHIPTSGDMSLANHDRCPTVVGITSGTTPPI